MALRMSNASRYIAATLTAATLMACNDPSSVDSPYIVTPVTTGALSGTPGWALTDTLVVEVRDVDGNLVPGAKVTWSLPNGGRLAVQLADADDPKHGTTDDRGRNYAVWTLGLDEGTQVAKVAAGLTGVPVEFEAEATVLHAKQVAAGGAHACAILNDQRLVCWGSNSNGGLGTGDAPSYVTRWPVPLPGLPAALEVRAATDDLTCARDLAGDVWCWGSNYFGQAGPVASMPFQLTPVRVPGAEGASRIALRSDYTGHTCALVSSEARCWGSNNYGQLGTGSTTSSSAPQPVVGSGEFVGIVAGYGRTCALDVDGETWCWGDGSGDSFSPLPSGTYTVPTRPIPGQHYYSLAVGETSVCGIQLSGVATCFGSMGDGGLGTRIDYPFHTTAPVRPDVGESFAAVTADGSSSFFGTSRYGEVFWWGGEYHSGFTMRPLPITPSFRVIDISASRGQYCVISEAGGVYCGKRDREYAFHGEERLIGVPAIMTP
ncbi:MAG: hypothetical protein R2910_07850 [Gemmatimonadales bacterium]